MRHLVETINLAYKASVNLAVWGRHGIGKTGAIEGLIEFGYYIKTIILSQSDPLTLGGYPGREQIRLAIVDKHAKEPHYVQVVDPNAPADKIEFITTFARPSWIGDCYAAAAEGKKVIVFLDEFNRADRYAHAAAMRLVNEGEICGHKVPKGTLFVMAMNPETETDADINPLSDPLLDRMCHIPVHSDPQNWLKWAEKANVNPLVRGFIKTNEERLNGFGDMEKLFDDQVLKRRKPTERSNHAVARILDQIMDEKGGINQAALKSHAVYHMIRGLCGVEYAHELVAYAENSYFQPFTADEMLKPTKDVFEKLTMLVEQGQTQVIAVSLDTARTEFYTKKLKAEKLSGFWKFLSKCPVDLQNAFWFSGTNQSKERAYWSLILAQENLPEEVTAAINK